MRKDNEILFLKFKIENIQNTLEYWKDKFERVHAKINVTILYEYKNTKLWSNNYAPFFQFFIIM